MIWPAMSAAARTVDLNLPAGAVAGVYIEDIVTGEVLVDINGDRSMIPASITKAITSASVLAEHKPDYRFETEVFLDGDINGNVAEGNLVIKVCGDPTIESSYFPENLGFADSIAAALRRMGVDKITGSVVVDSESFVNQPLPTGWVEEDFAWPYGAGHFSTNFRDNKFTLTMPAKKSLPHVPGLIVRHTPAKGSLKIERKRGSREFLAKGTVRKGRQEVVLSNPDPEATLRHEVAESLGANGIEVEGRAMNVANSQRHPLYTHCSPELSEILRSLMFRSDNMMAEGALRMIAPGESREKAVEREMRIWELRNIDTEGVMLEDGSGLSRNDRMTPYFMGDVLAWMASHYNATDYVRLFPKAGFEGTMKSFLKDSALEGAVAMKTGSMKDVQCYAGYKLDGEGFPTHVIVVMVNRFSSGRARIKSSIENLLLSTFNGLQ